MLTPGERCSSPSIATCARKSRWQLGRDYERYIGYLRERAGYTVTYHGIAEGLDDLGRDLIAERDGTIEVVQCKRWSRRKRIHEKHVFQLFGTVVLARIETPRPGGHRHIHDHHHAFPDAARFADHSTSRVEEQVPLEDYPRIKCNIARERRADLPPAFDQQYDRP